MARRKTKAQKEAEEETKVEVSTSEEVKAEVEETEEDEVSSEASEPTATDEEEDEVEIEAEEVKAEKSQIRKAKVLPGFNYFNLNSKTRAIVGSSPAGKVIDVDILSSEYRGQQQKVELLED